jgi:hypothetical protein
MLVHAFDNVGLRTALFSSLLPALNLAEPPSPLELPPPECRSLAIMKPFGH